MTIRQKTELNTLDHAEVAGKIVVVRVDLNVPMEHGRVSDLTRIRRLLPTLTELADKRAKVVILSHFDRPKGKFVPAMSLAPLVDILQAELNPGVIVFDEPESPAQAAYDAETKPHYRYPVKFGVDVLGANAKAAVEGLQPGELLLLENVRFHPGEETGDAEFAKALASLGDIFVNDAFSVSHRAHASVVGIADYLPAYAGRLLEQEVAAFAKLLNNPKRPLAAVVGGAKVSTKLEVLENLMRTVDYLIVGGAMANTFLVAQGKYVGKSLFEPDLVETAKRILGKAAERNCRIVLPKDFIVTREFKASAPSQIVAADAIPSDAMQLDIGPDSVHELSELLMTCQSLVWNGPLGAFETRPFDVSTMALARLVAGRTRRGEMFSLAGGGDTVSALTQAGLADEFSYLSTAGGAFLEWMQGRRLPGVAVLEKILTT